MSTGDGTAAGDADQAPLGRLILARLLVPAKRPPTVASVRKQLAPFFAHRLTTSEWSGRFDAALDGLVRAGDATAKPLGLTDAGRAKTLAFLGIEAVPSRLTWKALKDAWLTPVALGATVDSSRQRERLKSADGLKGYVLKREHRLSIGGCPTLKQALDALAWKQLGIETDRPLTREAVIEEFVGRLIDPTGRLKAKQLQEQLPAKALGASQTKPDELRLAAIRRWIEAAESRGADSPAAERQPEARPPASDGMNLERFAEHVRAAARDGRIERFGGNKVFIGRVWRRLEADAPFRAMGPGEFKRRLVEANRAGLLALSRADLVEAMDPGDVAASETRHLNAVFHFVQILPAEVDASADDAFRS